MILNFCAICGTKDDLHHHHFVAKSHGGSDDEKNMLTLCFKHHNEIHSKSYRNNLNHSKLTKEGLQRARARGIVLGNPNLVEYNKIHKRKAKKYAWEHKDLILSFQNNGMTYRQICAEMQKLCIKTSHGFNIWHPVQIGRILKRIKNGTII